MKENSQKYVINAGLFGAAGKLWAGTPSSVSPFLHGKVQAPGTNEKQALAKAGICDATGQILPAARPALDALGTAHAFTRMYLSGNLVPTEAIVYFAPGNGPVSLFNAGGDMEIRYPAAEGEFVEMAAQGFGSTIYRAVPFDATLMHDEAVALSALIDIQRKHALKSIAGEQEPGIADCELPVLWSITSRKGNNTQWLANVLLDILSLDGIPSEDLLRSALESLVQKGHAVKNGSSYRLGEDTLALARRMLLFDTALTLTSGYLKNGVLNIAGFTCLQAGVHDLLVIDANAESVTIQSVSSASVLDSVRTFFTDIHSLEKLDTPVAGTAQPQTRRFCPQCGAPITPDRKFCGSCGGKI
jgi:hypothetical protein